MATDAKTNHNWESGAPLFLNTAIGYMSCFKSWVQEEWIGQPCPDALTGQHWSRILANITSEKVAYARATGQRIVNPHEVADDEDHIAFGATCI